MFPIHDRQGRPTGFGARALDDSTPKYLNTSKTPVFDKGRTLYGLHLAAEPIRTQDVGVVVEGYMDVIAAHEGGFKNVVASMGTALTEQQVSQLKSLASDFVLALDPDAAGQEATLRSLESSWRVFERLAVGDRNRSTGALYQRKPLTLRIAALPSGRDPDTLIREEPGEWERLTQESVPVLDFLIPTLTSRFDLGSGHGKSQVVELLAPLITSADFLDQERYIRKLAEALDVGEDALKASIGGLRGRGVARSRRSAATDRTPEVSGAPLSHSSQDSLEDYTLALLLTGPYWKERVGDFAPQHFLKTENREVFTRWLSCSTIEDLRDSLDESLHNHLMYLTTKELVSTDRNISEAAVDQCLGRLERRYLQELQETLLESEDTSVPPPREMEDEIAGVNARLKELFSRGTG